MVDSHAAASCVALPCAETVGRMDAADEPTWTYLRRVMSSIYPLPARLPENDHIA